MNLYDIGEDIRALNDLLEEADGDISDAEVENAIDQWLDENAHNLRDKLNSYGAVIANHEAKAKANKEEGNRFMNRAKVAQNVADRLKKRLYDFFRSQNIDKIETGLRTFTICKNGGATPLVLDPLAEAHPEELPEEFRRVVFQIDRQGIHDALKSGRDLEFAQFGERGTHLRMR